MAGRNQIVDRFGEEEATHLCSCSLNAWRAACEFVGYSDGVAITFRPAGVADIPALAAIRAAEWETEAYWLRRIGGYLPEEGQQDRTILIAEDGANLVGFVAGHRTRRFGCDGELEWINVARESRGRGIGEMLVRAIGAWFVTQGARRICVDVEPDNAAARRLYSRCGAKPFKPYWMLWEDSRDMTNGANI